MSEEKIRMIEEDDIKMTHYGEEYFLSIPCSIYKFTEMKEYILLAINYLEENKK